MENTYAQFGVEVINGSKLVAYCNVYDDQMKFMKKFYYDDLRDSRSEAERDIVTMKSDIQRVSRSVRILDKKDLN